MKTRSAKQKGAAFQIEILGMLVDMLGIDSEDIESRPMGSNGADLIMGVSSKKIFPFAVECKRQERINIHAAWDQAVGNAGKLNPIVFHRRSRKPALVTLDARTFLEIVRRSNNGKSTSK